MTVCFVITAALLLLFVVTVVASVETVHHTLLFYSSSFLFNSLPFPDFSRKYWSVLQSDYSSVFFNFIEIHRHRVKMVVFMLYSLLNFSLLSISCLPLLYFLFFMKFSIALIFLLFHTFSHSVNFIFNYII